MKIKNINKKIISLIMSGVCSVVLATEASQAFETVALDAISSISCTTNGKEKIKIPKEYKEYIDLDTKKYTTKELESLKYLNLTILEKEDLNWMRYCTNIEELSICIEDNFLEDVREELKVINDCNFQKLNSFWVTSTDDTLIFNEQNFAFLKKSSNLESLTICMSNIDSGFLESLTSIKKLKLASLAFHTKIDFSKLSNLEEVDFSYIYPYDLAMFLTNEDINYLKDNNISIKTEHDDTIDRVIEINNEIEFMINELGISKEEPEEDKIKKIVNYVLEKLHYDEKVYDMLSPTADVDDSKIVDYINENFYKEGVLSQALSDSGNAICGNYAALTQVLATRLGLNSYYLGSHDHAWNLLELDNKYYYLDTTYMDSVDKSIPLERHVWYLKTVEEVSIKDKSHYPTNLPDDIQIESVKKVENYYKQLQLDIEKKEKKIAIYSSASVLLGVVTLGFLINFFIKSRIKEEPKIKEKEK